MLYEKTNFALVSLFLKYYTENDFPPTGETRHSDNALHTLNFDAPTYILSYYFNALKRYSMMLYVHCNSISGGFYCN